MLANSEFVAILKQANTDAEKIAEVVGVSESQLEFVSNAPSGMGLIKCGNVIIPFDNTIRRIQGCISYIIRISMRRLQRNNSWLVICMDN